MATTDEIARVLQAKLLARGIILDRMPAWDDDKRAIANVLARSAVFGVVERGAREACVSQRVHAPAGYEIALTGNRLSEAHRDAYLEVLHLFRDTGPETSIRLNPRMILHGIGRADGGKNRKWLFEALLDVAQAELALKIIQHDGSVRFECASLCLLQIEGSFDTRDGVTASLSHEALRLYQQDGLTYIRPDRRRALKGPGSQLAKALQAKFCSHKAPYPMKLETLTDQCGVRDKNRSGRKRSLQRALEMLVKTGELEGYLFAPDGKVCVERASREKAPRQHV